MTEETNVEELEAMIDRMAVTVPPIIAVRTGVTAGAYVPPNDDRPATEDDIYIAHLVTAYDADSNTVVTIPVLYDPEFAVETGVLDADTANSLIVEAVYNLNNPEEAAQ